MERLKELIEKRNAIMEKMDEMLKSCEKQEDGTEARAFTEDEAETFGALETEIRALDVTIKALETREKLERADKTPEGDTEKRTLAENNFLKYVRGEERALDIADNGGIIPAHIANMIIEKVRELSPIYAMATKFNVGGDLIFPTYDETISSISAAFVDDLQELTEGTGKFTTVKLENFIVGCLAKISRSLMNRTDFDLLSFIVHRVATTIAEFLEKKLIQGESGKNVGVLGATQIVTAPSAVALTADELIDLQMKILQPFQPKASWIMSRNTLKALRKLKDANGEYLLNKDITTAFGWSLLGKPVYLTESMPEIASGAKVIAYGDMSGLYVKLAQNMQIQILMEKYATQHATGVVGYVEFDSKIVEVQKIALLQMA